MTIDNELINSFISYFRNQGLKEKTLYRFKYDFMAFFRWLKENKKDRVEDIDKLTIEGYKGYLFSLCGSNKSRYGKQEHLCSGTINQKLLVIKHFLEFTNYVFDLGIEAGKIKMNKVDYKTGDYFTIDELKEIVKAIDKTEKYRINQCRLRLIIALCFVSGARMDEMSQITIEGIRNRKQKVLGKNSKERWIFFNETCQKILEGYLEEQKKEIPRLGMKLKRKNTEGYAVIGHGYGNFGSKIGKQAICDMFKKLNEYLKRGKHITLHTLRHSYATVMIDNGTNPFHLKELMGHSKINTTMGYYHKNWNILEGEQRKVFNEIEI